MRTPTLPLVLGLFGLGLAGLQAEEGERHTFKTKDGKEYFDCEIIDRNPDGITFRHRGGIARITFDQFPGHVQERYDYDPEKARKYVLSCIPKPPKPVHRPQPVVRPVSDTVRAGALAARPRLRRVNNPYLLSGSLYNPAALGAAFGGFQQPYFAGSFGTPALVTPVPGGFFTANTLRVGARPLIESPVAPGMASYSQYRDARAGAVRAAVRATPSPRVVTFPVTPYPTPRSGQTIVVPPPRLGVGARPAASFRGSVAPGIQISPGRR